MSGHETSALDIGGVSHSYGKHRALDDVSLTVAPGEFCGLLGLNGAGKTTLFSLITRLFDNTSGHVRIIGHDVRRQPKQALQQLGVVFQTRTLDSDLSVMQNMIYHAALHGMPAGRARIQALKELERVGLAERAADKVRGLSGGQLRRVEIARALLHRPKLLLLDEPTVGLDIGARQDIIAHVRRLIADDGLSILWATHLMDEIDPQDKIVILDKGRVVCEGNCAEITKPYEGDLKAAFNDLIGRAGDEAA